jgi:hypothetical protein
LWIRDLQASIAPLDSQHNFTGTDIEASYFPKDTPTNTSYQLQNITKPWPVDWNAKFDLVHQRLALMVPGNEENTVEALRAYVDLLKPGGWIQLVEVRQWNKESDGQAFKDLSVCLSDMIKTIGASLEHIDKAKGWLQELGLVDTQEQTVEANYGTREDKKVQEIAKRAILTTADSILNITSSKCRDIRARIQADRTSIPTAAPELAAGQGSTAQRRTEERIRHGACKCALAVQNSVGTKASVRCRIPEIAVGTR